MFLTSSCSIGGDKALDTVTTLPSEFSFSELISDRNNNICNI